MKFKNMQRETVILKKQNKTKPTVTVKANTQRSKQKLCNFALQKHYKPSQKTMDKHVKSICSSYHKELILLICEELLEVKKKKPDYTIQK